MKNISPTYLLFLGLLFCLPTYTLNAQSGIIKGQIICTETGKYLNGAEVFIDGNPVAIVCNDSGIFTSKSLTYGKHLLVFYYFGKQSIKQEIDLQETEVILKIKLVDLGQKLEDVEVISKKNKNFGRSKLFSVENFGLYEGKKTEVIELSEISANTATNNARQVYSKITGLNIWESDGAGLQLGIGGRGLSPNRTANFNVRQNGYDISADALGYPESYYTPPVEALERIELVRGAASLQYGTQFGGMLNFRFKQGPRDKPFEFTTRQTAGSWGFFNSFNSVGGTLAKGKLNYYSYVQYKRGDGFRPNSGFDAFNAFAGIQYQATQKLKIDLEWTKMSYLAQQPGGLTDRNFEENPRQSFRDRNWFSVDWNMFALNFTYEFSENTQINIRNFGLLAQRDALGNLERINVVDFGGNRTMIRGEFKNIGNETRLLHRYMLGNQKQTLLVGTRAYNGTTTARQGDANNQKSPDFNYLNPNNLENSDYIFNNQNVSIFVENIFQVNQKWSITPGIRWEYIGTYAQGYYKQRVLDGAGNIIVENRTDEKMGRERDFFILGIGSQYQYNKRLAIYANITQNYRAINFSDIRIINPNFRVDPNIQDETGFTADLGLRAQKENFFNTEFTAFLVRYNNKIGQVLRADQPPLFLDYRFRGNISDALNWGFEFFGEINLLQYFKKNTTEWQWTVFINAAYVNARYINTEDKSIQGKQVEMVPPVMLRTGTQARFKNFKVGFQFSHMAAHYTDATNAFRSATAVEGIIPAYQVADLSMQYQYKRYGIEFSINNLFNQMYFTRRAEGYPGPGIIPSDGRGFFGTLSYRL